MGSGVDNVNGHRKTPWPFYLCGRKKREGWESCPTGKIGAKGSEEAVLRLINEQVLTAEFVKMLVSKVNENLARNTPDGLEAKIGEKQQQVTEVQRSIHTLLDLAEQFGATSAGARRVEREAELKQLQTELRELELRREEGRLETCPEQVQNVLKEMRDSLMGASIDDQRTTLAEVLVGMEMGATNAGLILSLPLSEVTGIHKMPPRDLQCRRGRHFEAALSRAV